ncbi:MAG: hypothetical protein ACK4ND_12325 [Cytophagaceae bacterium]
MKRKIILILTAYVLLPIVGIVSCNKHDCGPFPNRYKTVGLDWFNYKAIYSDNPDSSFTLSEIENDSVDYNQYAILIKPKQETYFARSSNFGNFSLVKTAYACSPVEPKTDEKIDSIVITSTKDYNANHPSGSDLSDLFDVVVVDHSNHVYYERYSLSNYIKTTPFVPNELTLLLKEEAQQTTDFEFLVKFYQDGIDKDYFEFLTNSIVIRKK